MNDNTFSNKNLLKAGLTAFFVIAAAIMFYLVLNNVNTVLGVIGYIIKLLMPMIYGLIIAFLLSTPLNAIENWLYKKREVSKKNRKTVRLFLVILLVLFFLFLFYEFFALIIPQLYESFVSIKSNSRGYLANFQNWFNGIIDRYPEISVQLNSFVDNLGDNTTKFIDNNIMPKMNDYVALVTTGIVSVIKTIINLIVGIIVSIYVLFNKELYVAQTKKLIYATFKRDTANNIVHNLRFIHKTFNVFVSGSIIDSLIIGLLCFIFCTIIGTPYPVLISVIIGVTNIIPAFGPFIGAIPAAFFIFVIDPMQCLYFIILILILQQFDGNILKPFVLGASTGLSALWIVFSITFFGSMWGLIGMLIGVPLFAVIYATIKQFTNNRLEGKNLTTDSYAYRSVDYIDDNDNFIKVPKEHINTIANKKKSKTIDAIKDVLHKNDK